MMPDDEEIIKWSILENEIFGDEEIDNENLIVDDEYWDEYIDEYIDDEWLITNNEVLDESIVNDGEDSEVSFEVVD